MLLFPNTYVISLQSHRFFLIERIRDKDREITSITFNNLTTSQYACLDHFPLGKKLNIQSIRDIYVCFKILIQKRIYFLNAIIAFPLKLWTGGKNGRLNFSFDMWDQLGPWVCFLALIFVFFNSDSQTKVTL